MFLSFMGAWHLNLINNYAKNPIVKMLIESLVFSRYIYALSVWGPAIGKGLFMSAESFPEQGSTFGLWLAEV